MLFDINMMDIPDTKNHKSANTGITYDKNPDVPWNENRWNLYRNKFNTTIINGYNVFVLFFQKNPSNLGTV